MITPDRQKRINDIRNLLLIWCFSVLFSSCNTGHSDASSALDLSGKWTFRIDSTDLGTGQQWFKQEFEDVVTLPGSMTTNGKGNDIGLSTPWTGSFLDSSYFKAPSYKKYRQAGNIKVPFWLQPEKYYKGVAWYQKQIEIPSDWKGKSLEFKIERGHWETTVWLDDQLLGTENSLGTPQVFELPENLAPGTYTLSVKVDNRVKDIDVGINSHSISDHTQSNWNGMVGELSITAKPLVHIEKMALYPDIEKKEVNVKLVIANGSGGAQTVKALFKVTGEEENLPENEAEIKLEKGENSFQLSYAMGDSPVLWDEFTPHLYEMSVQLNGDGFEDIRKAQFGMRKFATKGSQLTINNRLTFMRGTLECAIFPKTGYPPTDKEEWKRIINVCKSFGLNHMRFHSWCPPEAAFDAADELGFYFQVECSSWANFSTTIGDGSPLDTYIMEESERIIEAYGNHPSFCFMAYGNEPGGEHHKEYLRNFVEYWKTKDPRRLYTTAAGWPVIDQNDFNSTSDPRIQGWGQGLNSIINKEAPSTDYDWSAITSQWEQPTISHEIGQWCVYPDFEEISKYTGVFKPKNFEIFKDRLYENGLGGMEKDFLMASGKLQALCYKADIEAALRTPGFGGFQLLDLHDFPGQGTALVGVLDPFWEEKGYITAEEYSRFCNATVPLVRLSRRVFINNESFDAQVEIAHFGKETLKAVVPKWKIKHSNGETFARGNLPETDIPLGNGISLGEIHHSLSGIQEPEMLTLEVSVNDFVNSWPVWVYPEKQDIQGENKVRIARQLGAKEKKYLEGGGTLLLSLPKGSLKDEAGGDIAVGFSSIFWNTAWTNGQAPHTLGILCDPEHPAFAYFPTQNHSNWQWWDAMSHSNAIRLDHLSNGIKPVLRVIDDWFTSESLGLLVECKIGEGKLLISGIDLLKDQQHRPEARQLLYSLQRYMNSNVFNPETQLTFDKVKSILK